MIIIIIVIIIIIIIIIAIIVIMMMMIIIIINIYDISNEIKSDTQPRKNYNISVPECFKNEVGEYALIHETKSVLEKFRKKYPRYTFIRRTSVNNWKNKIEKDKKMIMPPSTEEKVNQTS